MQKLFTWLDTKKGFYIAISIISLLSAILRFIRITFPTSRVFDEVYSPAFAWKLLHHENYFDIHPVLAELPHSIGLLLFGDTPMGWRLGPFIWGIIFCWATAFVAYLLANRRLTGVIAALLVSLDTAFFVYGRTGLPDMFLLSQIALALTFFFLSMRVKSKTHALLSALVSGLFIGNVISTKWLGLAIFGVIWSWIIIFGLVALLKKRGKLTNTEVLLPRIKFYWYPILFFVLPFVVYFLWLIPMLGWQPTRTAFWGQIVWWHQSVWNYNTTLTATHPYSSKWWQWPFVIHPVLFFWEQADGGRRVINATGNVVLWWSGFVALIGTIPVLIRKFRPRILWLLVASLCFWLPWIKIGRIAFNYHYFETFFFEILLMSLILTYLADKPKWRPFIIAFFVMVFISFVLLYPEASGMFVPSKIPFVPFFFPY
jgi:dolichyl-phosphate-mannose--protein O-mannosyl transferase